MAERIGEISRSSASDYVSLCKPMISLLAAATSCAGYLFFSPRSMETFGVGLGVFLLSCGAGALNNCQDRDLDRQSKRTAHRPMADGRIPLSQALILSFVLILMGSLELWLVSHSLLAVGMGLVCIVVYNGLYTPLKRVSSLAFVPGALCGFLAAYLGWVAAGGVPPSQGFFLFLLIILIWQFPHYFLIGLIHREDFRGPNIFQDFTISALENWTVLWILSYACLTLTLNFTGIALWEMGNFILLLNGAGLVIGAIVFLSKKSRFKMYGFLRAQLTFSQTIITLLLMTQY